MITWLTGENSFELHEAKKACVASFDGEPEYYDGTELTLADLPTILMGVSLFAQHRLVIISDIAQNAALWSKVPEWLPRVSDDSSVVFVDAKPDKRTTAYKALKAAATVREFAPWTDRDTAKAEAWVVQRANALGVTLARLQARHLVARVGVDQWQLAQAVTMLSLLDAITDDAIDTHIAKNTTENVFELFELALTGDMTTVHEKLQALKMQEDAHRLLGLLSSQVLSLAAVVSAPETANPAKDFGIHPYVVGKMRRYTRKLSKHRVAELIEAFARADAAMKRSKAEPWLLVERALIDVAAIASQK